MTSPSVSDPLQAGSVGLGQIRSVAATWRKGDPSRLVRTLWEATAAVGERWWPDSVRRLTVGTIPSTAPTANRYDLLTKVVQTIAIAVPASIQVADCGIYRCGAISYAEVVESYLETITWRVFATYFYRLVYILL